MRTDVMKHGSGDTHPSDLHSNRTNERCRTITNAERVLTAKPKAGSTQRAAKGPGIRVRITDSSQDERGRGRTKMRESTRDGGVRGHLADGA